MNTYYDQLVTWCGGNYYLQAACDVAIGFLPALAIGYFCFHVFKRSFPDRFRPLSGWHFALLFGCACWSVLFFSFALAPLYRDGIEPLRWLDTALLINSLLAPISTFVGIPSVLIYVFRRPALGKLVIHGLATTILVLCYCYHLWIIRVFH